MIPRHFFWIAVALAALFVLGFIWFERSAFEANLRSRTSEACELPTTKVEVGIDSHCELPRTEVVFNTIVQGLFQERVIPPGDILDIGASEGDWSCAFACFNRDRIVHAADPNHMLRHTLPCPALGNIRIHTLAMSDTLGKVSFNPKSVKAYVGSLETKRNDGEGNVEVTTLDRFFQQQKSFPGFMHLDVEWYELKLIVGGRATIAQYRPPFSFEVHMNTSESRRTIAAVEQLGYSVFMVNEGCGVTENCRNNLAFPHNATSPFNRSLTLKLAVRTGSLLHVTSKTADAVYAAHQGFAKPWQRSANEKQFGKAQGLLK